MWNVITGNAPPCMGIEKRQYKVLYNGGKQQVISGDFGFIYIVAKEWVTRGM